MSTTEKTVRDPQRVVTMFGYELDALRARLDQAAEALHREADRPGWDRNDYHLTAATIQVEAGHRILDDKEREA